MSTELAVSIAEKLQNGTYDCVVCTEPISLRDKLWSCSTCSAVFHLPCVVYWARSQAEQQRVGAQHHASHTGPVGESFRCPLCQSKCLTSTTTEYRCYCKRLVNPPADPTVVLGSCGQQCGKRRADDLCPHPCGLQCHPGPCPPCTHHRDQPCYCGAEEQKVGCSSGVHGFECGSVCGKEKSCGRHYCERLCHAGPCPPCEEQIEVKCHCGSIATEKRCAQDVSFSCGRLCPKKMDCGNHDCGQVCHDGPCSICLRTLSRQASCPCGQTPLWKIYYEHPDLPSRTQCTDPVPTCGSVCSIPLSCGMHMCPRQCHDSPCAPCLELVPLSCRCGTSSKKVPCFVQYTPKSDWKAICMRYDVSDKLLPADFPFVCQKRCKKPLSCGRHQCDEVCCTNTDHVCYLVCRKKAPCGIHECGRLCHKGICPGCLNSSFERLFCRCRRTFVEPPVPCGTLPPNCMHPCSIPRECGHPPNHVCHIDDRCPDCVVPVEKSCGSHNSKMPFLMPCYLKSVSCGRQCGKVVANSLCTRVCHMGQCDETAESFPTLAAAAAEGHRRVPPPRNAWARR